MLMKADGEKVRHPVCRREIITPEVAADFLCSNDRNRKLKESQVARIAAVISRGFWRFNGETIKIDWNGQVVDGQHRLEACVRTGMPIDTLLVTGLEPEVYHSLGGETPRTLADLLGQDGVASAFTVASAAGWYQIFCSANWRTGELRKFLRQELEMFAQSSPMLQEVAKRVMAKPVIRRRLMASGMAAALWTLFAERDATLAELFMEQLADGIGLMPGDPALAVRNRLLMLERNSSANQLEAAAITVRGWNALRRGEPLTLARGYINGKNPSIE